MKLNYKPVKMFPNPSRRMYPIWNWAREQNIDPIRITSDYPYVRTVYERTNMIGKAIDDLITREVLYGEKMEMESLWNILTKTLK